MNSSLPPVRKERVVQHVSDDPRTFVFDGPATTLSAHADRPNSLNVFLRQVIDDVWTQNWSVDEKKCCPFGICQLTSDAYERKEMIANHLGKITLSMQPI